MDKRGSKLKITLSGTSSSSEIEMPEDHPNILFTRLAIKKFFFKSQNVAPGTNTWHGSLSLTLLPYNFPCLAGEKKNQEKKK